MPKAERSDARRVKAFLSFCLLFPGGEKKVISGGENLFFIWKKIFAVGW